LKNVNDFDEAFESSTAKRKYEDRMAQKFSTFQINDNSIDDSQQTNCDKFSITELADTDTDW
jgi:hypothetical protein